ncbi:hypothetical protein FOA52_014735 [Chlamydomonas sp. UWO 241]|nr:hypothetical protein FOA52_014735 [Chlamydomonas sp. UWO 241]
MPASGRTLWPDASQLVDLRQHPCLPEGKVLYIQSGDPGDFDGYLIGVAGQVVAANTKDMMYALVVPERRACPDRAEADVNKHDEAFSEEVMRVSGCLFRQLCPDATIVRGPLNKRNVIPLKFIFNELDKYGPVTHTPADPCVPVNWKSVRDLAAVVNRDDVTSLVIDVNGSIGYLQLLMPLCPKLGVKLKASGMPVTIMAGVLAELESTTLRLPGRDPRSTMNALYHADAIRTMLDEASKHSVPLLFVTNNVCNAMLKFDDADELVKSMSLVGLLQQLAEAWYGPHLHGKCVPFDWVSFTAMLAHGRFPGLLRMETRQLYVGEQDASVLVLKDPNGKPSATVEENLLDTKLWGSVESLVSVDRTAMLELARLVSHSAHARSSDKNNGHTS